MGVEEKQGVAGGLVVKTSSAIEYEKCNIRANFKLGGKSDYGWCAISTSGEWVEIDARSEVLWNKIETKGRAGQYVKSYKLKYSNDGASWTDIEGTFTGNSDATSVKTNVLKEPIKARMIRIYPLTYHSHTSMKFEAYYTEQYTLYIYIYRAATASAAPKLDLPVKEVINEVATAPTATVAPKADLPVKKAVEE